MKDRFVRLISRLRAALLGSLVVLACALPARAEMQLAMFEEDGCIWCARWHREVGPAYPNTAAGKAAPLRQLDLHAPVPDDIALARPAAFSPTFVLLDDGAEVGRIEGYPGEDFFWALLEEMIAGAASPDS